jgi:ribosomal protein S18 acetylase RimI-like enzyme
LEAYYNQFYTIDNLMKEQTEINSRVFLAIEENRIVGFVRIRETNEAKDKLGSHIVELHRLYVLTSAQGKAVGKNLMHKAIEYAREKKYEWIWLGVWEKNVKAQKFYAAFGFEKFSEHTFWQGVEPQLDWMLKKKL